MTGGSHVVSPRVAGRAEELRELDRLIGLAADGESSAVFVHGEAGIGKTRLVQAAAETAAGRGFQVLWGRAVRFAAAESPLLPWTIALEGWVRDADPAARNRLRTAATEAVALIPSLAVPTTNGADPRPGREPPARPTSERPSAWVVEAVLAHILGQAPTLLVMDDAQWADAASRDVLSYMLAGLGTGQRLLVLATCRSGGLSTGDPLHGWLADVRRLPSVRELHLDRLDSDETGAQLAALLRREPSPGLVAEVQDRTGGNPYLTELLATGLETDTETLPPGSPLALQDALLAAWHALNPSAREVLRALAVGGLPAGVDELVDVCAVLGADRGQVTAALREGLEAGIVIRVDPGHVWFRHPLLAEVLYATFLPGEPVELHARWAARLQRQLAEPIDDAEAVRHLGELAIHQQRTGDSDACRRTSVLAADAARRVGLWREEANHLKRAVEQLGGAEINADAVGLCERAAETLSLVGDWVGAVRACDHGVPIAEALGDRLTAYRLLTIRWDETPQDMDHPEPLLDEIREQVRLLSEHHPDSHEHAGALTDLSFREYWLGRNQEAKAHAHQALDAARRSGSSLALSYAHQACHHAHYLEKVEEYHASEAIRHGRACGDVYALALAWTCMANFLTSRGRQAEATQLRSEALEYELQHGALAEAAGDSGLVARELLDQGRMVEAAALVRRGFSLTSHGGGVGNVRLAAIVLSLRRGDLDAADLHLLRLREAWPDIYSQPGLEAPPSLAEHLLAHGRATDAVGMLTQVLSHHMVDPRVVDRMLVWGARACADMAVSARDRRDPGAQYEATATLEQLKEVRAGHPGAPFTVAGSDDRVQPAMHAVYDAEEQRCRRGDDVDAWLEAADRCESATLTWEAHRARLRAVQTQLALGPLGRDAVEHCRAMHAFASREGAIPLLTEVEAFATAARISLEPARKLRTAPGGSPLVALTPREREVLSFLVAGRTYAEIAAALFISEKTVSAHVSNLLRKTGTRSRGEAAALAVRLQALESADG